MGQIKGSNIKKASLRIVSKNYLRLTDDFYNNRDVIKETTVIQSKKLTNKVAGYVTRLMRRIDKGQVIKKLYIKQHEDQIKKLEKYVPKESYLDEEVVIVDADTKEMLEKYGITGKYEVAAENLEYSAEN